MFLRNPGSVTKALAFCFLTTLIIGCGGGGGEKYTGPLGTIGGKVTLKDKPAPEGTMIAFSSTGEKSFLATGQTDTEGNYSIIWNGSTKIPVGKYKISVTAPSTITETDPDKLMQMSEKGELSSETAISAKYNNPATSKLETEVTEGENTFDIPLE